MRPAEALTKPLVVDGGPVHLFVVAWTALGALVEAA
jgi:hypothetical protein